MGRNRIEVRNHLIAFFEIIADLCIMIADNDKSGLLNLARLMKKRGIKHLIISPGSRNAPVVSVFCNDPFFECLVIVDERSAAFFALGIAMKLQKPAAIVCTSGSAALNYAPAVAEAYYQHVPLIILTADRPVEWIDQGDGQTIRQKEVFRNYVKASYELPETIRSQDDRWFNDRLVSEALNAAIFPTAGPVHINLPFTEPLYGFSMETENEPKTIDIAETGHTLSAKTITSLKKDWEKTSRKLILVGQQFPGHNTSDLLEKLANFGDVVVLTETTSNLNNPRFISTIDRCLAAIGKDTEAYEPELLVTFGGHIVSKKIKTFLRNAAIKTHWHIDPVDWQMDTYQHLTTGIPMKADAFLEQLMPKLYSSKNNFNAIWQHANTKAAEHHHSFIAQAKYSDLKVFDMLLNTIPQHYDIHLANSTPVRYAQLFDFKKSYNFYSNRGTSGIDGCSSTAVGSCFAVQKPSLLITGDLAFFYDSNAFWNPYVSPFLKVIIINNQGGGIFRFIDGPAKTGLLESHFEARHQTRAKNLAATYGLHYFEADSLESLTKILPEFYKPQSKAALLEIQTPPEASSEQLVTYFKFMARAADQT
ncbi:MAG: 2-succinyl-5-enolpyruvyl-6-hydroxy-3-cyclohexene-1-carboxylic-acid synthase [Bacteroidetes bacterium]|jgi:2-succinyl-5-enolpyruvyl-6-hydroxy-3-cyclohexene-1-carboxylate synthase|nr:2-succinyl-5-enolpyruvyl-6-hydroxy-3-cyclohexene-1-carboxylic-acid synthase [Bacteroidota bacterium]